MTKNGEKLCMMISSTADPERWERKSNRLSWKLGVELSNGAESIFRTSTFSPGQVYKKIELRVPFFCSIFPYLAVSPIVAPLCDHMLSLSYIRHGCHQVRGGTLVGFLRVLSKLSRFLSNVSRNDNGGDASVRSKAPPLLFRKRNSIAGNVQRM